MSPKTTFDLESGSYAASHKTSRIELNCHLCCIQKPELEGVFKPGVLGNYEPINIRMRSGPGEDGVAVILDPSEKAAADASVREFGFNMVASDKISLDRRIKDTRNPECKYWHYPETSKLPRASVVLVFVNEGWSTLIRTVHSVINTSPPELLADIIMVDDFSNKSKR